MEYKIQLTAKARKDLNDIYSYIKSVLFDEITAINQIIRLRDNMNNLNMFPHRYREHKDITWRKNALRMMPVDNYIVSYVIDENSMTVKVVRIFYGRRDLSGIFKATPHIE